MKKEIPEAKNGVLCNLEDKLVVLEVSGCKFLELASKHMLCSRIP
jgi:hypothetical protein